MNKRTKNFLMVIALLVITDSYAGVADGLDKIMNPQEPVDQKPKVKPKPTHPTQTKSNTAHKSAEQSYLEAKPYYEQNDYNKALPLLRASAEQGYANAQSRLGYMYNKGIGVAQDDNQAVMWYRKAAEQGNASAQSNLGFM
ncbi:MAG: tetratricopeptide repeat protein, partial [Methylococcales bacterium]